MRKALHLTLVFLLFSAPLHAAFPAGALYELNASAANANLNSGGFDTGNANFIADWTVDTNTANTATPVVSSATYAFVAGDDEHWMYFQTTGGGGVWYASRFCQIGSVTGGKATLRAAAGECLDYALRVMTPNTTVGIASTGTPTGGVAGIDYSRSTTQFITGTDLASTSGTSNPCQVTSVAFPFAANLIGNALHVTAGSNWSSTGNGSWHFITSLPLALTASLDGSAACGTNATLTNGTFYIGGAMRMNSTLDDDFMETAVAGNQYFVKNGSYTIGESVSIAAAGGGQNPVLLTGYNTIRGDAPTGTNRPTWSAGANATSFAANWNISNWIWTGTSAAGVTLGVSGVFTNVKSTNTATAADLAAWTVGSNAILQNCEAVSYRGNAIVFGAATTPGAVASCYIHDSNVGVANATTTGIQTFTNNILTSFVAGAFSFTGALGGRISIRNNTIHGWNTPLGTGVNMATTLQNMSLVNNIITGFANGVDHADPQSVGYDNYNDYYNNTEDIDGCGATASCTTWQKGANDISTNPSFTSVGYVSGSGDTTSGSVLTATGDNLSTIVAGRDYLYVSATTGGTQGFYGITAVDDTADTITTDIALGSGTGVSWQVTTVRNFLPTVSLAGFPGAFQGGYTTGSLGIGAVQRSASGGGGGGGIIGQ